MIRRLTAYLLPLLLVLPGLVSSAAAQSADVYEDPGGAFTVPIPTGWSAEEGDGFVLLTDPDGEIQIWALVVEAETTEAGISAGWEAIEPGFSEQPVDTTEAPAPEGVDEVFVLTYDTGQASGEIVQGAGQRVGDEVYTLLVRAPVIAAQQRQSQINVIFTGFTITSLETDGLTGVEPRSFDADLAAELTTYIETTLERLEVPGATVAIVQDGQVVYREGFGVKELGGSEPVSPETRMMIGSTTKSMTTMMLATLVDDGVISWDTPVVDILPTFSVADPELTPTITVRDLVCACTGVPRRDFELLFNANELSAQDIIDSVGAFEFFTPIGEAFQYSNQMVAVGGYAGAVAASGDTGDLLDAYTATMQERIFEPMGLAATTFSFQDVIDGGNYASPHGANLAGEYVPLPLDDERFVVPVAPSGGVWSNVDDLASYLLTELDGGMTPDGIQVVSTDNLSETWEPQVAISAESSYGLGWIVEQYQGLRLIQHGGNTLGFTSDVAFLPDAGVGIAVLANGQAANLFTEAVRFRALELTYGQDAEYDDVVDAALAEAGATPAASPESAATPEIIASPIAVGTDATPGALTEPVDPADAAQFEGTYANDALGTIEMRLENDVLTMDAGEFAVEIRGASGQLAESAAYVVFDPPLAGVPVSLEMAGDAPVIVIGAGVTEYIFEAA